MCMFLFIVVSVCLAASLANKDDHCDKPCVMTLLVGWSLVGHVRKLWLNGANEAYSNY